MSKVSAIVLASGHSKRFGSDKLEYLVNGKTMFEITVGRLKNTSVEKIVVVARKNSIIDKCKGMGVCFVKNDDVTDDTAETIKLGMQMLTDEDGVMLCVCDEPYLKTESIEKLINDFSNDNQNIYAVSFEGEQGNPVIFPKRFFNELSSLNKNERGKTVIKRHLSCFRKTEVSSKNELKDLDAPL